jgi:hypothetical protein
VSDSNSGQAAPGWYPTTPGSSQLRWWDGTQWTEHYQALGAAPVSVQAAPAGTRPGTVWIWIFVLVPLLEFAELPLLASVYPTILSATLSTSTSLSASQVLLGPGYFALLGIGFAIYAVYVVAAALDYRALKARGVPAPFHWAWTLLSSIVYIIGRTVVVRRRTGAGLAPLWVYLGASAIRIIATMVVVLPIVGAAVNSAVNSAG